MVGAGPARENGIGGTLIAPGQIETPFWDRHGGPPEGPTLSADQLAESIVWAMSQPAGVDVNTLTVRPIGTADNHASTA